MRAININKKGKYNFRIFLQVIVLFGFIVSTIYFAIKIAAIGDKLTFLNKKEVEIESRNRELSLEIVSSTSLSKFSDESRNLGFIKPSNILYIKAEEAVAKLP